MAIRQHVRAKQIWWKSVKKWLRYACLLHLFAYFQDDGRPPSWTCYSTVLDYPRSPLDGLYLFCQWRDDSVWSTTETLRLYFFGIWVENAYSRPFGAFLGAIKEEMVRYWLTELVLAFRVYYLQVPHFVKIDQEMRQWTCRQTDKRRQKRSRNQSHAMLLLCNG